MHWGILAIAFAAFLVHPVYRHILESGSSRAAQGHLPSQAAHGAFYLLSRLFLPHRLNIDPDLGIPPGGSPAVAAEAAGLAFLFALGVYAIRKRTLPGFGILWFFLHLSPTNSFVPRVDVANERHLYLACWGIFLCAGWGIGRLEATGVPRRKWVPSAASTALLLAGLTIARNHAYRSEAALWESTVRLSPAKARAHNNLGFAYQLSGMREKAVESYREALRLDPGFRLARGNLEALMREETPERDAGGRAGR